MSKSFRWIGVALLSIIVNSIGFDANAQCCSPGNPVAGTSFVGILDPQSMRSITYFRHSFSDTYYEGSEEAELQGKTANFNFIGQMIGLGLTKRFGVELELGYFINKKEEDEWVGLQQTFGWSNGALLVKGLIFKSSGIWEVTGSAGWKFPLGKRVFLDEYGFPYASTLQPSTRAHGAIGQLFIFRSFPEIGARAILINRFETNAPNIDKYKFGNAWFSSLFLSKTWRLKYSTILQIRNEYRNVDYQGETMFAVTGGDVLFVSPQFAYSFPPSWVISALVDIPVYRNYNGLQLSPKLAFGLSVVKDIHFKKAE